MQKTTTEVLKDIQKNSLSPIYLLHGDEHFFIDQLMDEFEAGILSEDQKVLINLFCMARIRRWPRLFPTRAGFL